MDVLRPQLVYIGGRCYRKNPVDQKSNENYEEEEHFSQPEEPDIYADEICDAFINIEETDGGYKTTLDIPNAYFKYIIGKKGETKKRIENETRTQIRIPRQGETGVIVIKGRERQGLVSAKTRIDVLVESARQRQPFTHFLSFPVAYPHIIDKFEEFKSDILRFCDGDRGLDSSIFQNAKKLHLTLGTLVLLNDTEIQRAVDLLQSCKEDLAKPILAGAPLVAQFKGLEYMNDDPGAVDVLYAKVQLQDESDRLQMLADRLVDRFVSEGLMQLEYDHVKLHVTIMNTLMRRDPSGTSLPRSDRHKPTERESFDASNILKMYGHFDFGIHTLTSVHLSQRYSTGTDGYYASADQLQL